MASFKNDYIKGTENEIKIIDVLESYFSDNIKQVESKNSIYDYTGDKCIYELKTRNNEYNKYETTLITHNKIINNIGKKQIFIFSFTDGLYYIEYNEELFNTFETKMFKRFQRTDYNDKYKKHIFIPIKHLIKIK